MSAISNLLLSIKEEKLAASHYRSRAKTADPVTAKLYRHIASEEDGHAHEFQRRLEQLRRGK